MTAGERRLVMVVNNEVSGDSRVQRTARAAADAGWRVRVVGRATGPALERYCSHAVETLLVPVEPILSQPRGRRDAAAVRRARSVLAVRDRDAGHAGAVPALRFVRHGAWRLLDPWVQDLELAFAPFVEQFRPHLIHAHDRHTIPLAARSAAALRAAGLPTAWVLDAHEYVAATAGRGARGLRGFVRRAMVVGEQGEFIRDADGVVTVSRTLAARLQRDHRLVVPPTVILNSPAVGEGGGATPTLRDVVRVGPATPLVVYAGGCAPPRGVSSAVEALVQLPQVHLALVTAADDPHVPGLLALADDLGVRDRTHRVDYVPAEHVVDLLASADVGLVPLLHRPNHEISLVTKYLEYLHAGLPVVTSDVREMAHFTQEHRLGEVFTAGDPAALAEALRSVLAARDAYAARVRSSAAVAATAWASQARRLLDVYDSAAERALGDGSPSGNRGERP